MKTTGPFAKLHFAHIFVISLQVDSPHVIILIFNNNCGLFCSASNQRRRDLRLFDVNYVGVVTVCEQKFTGTCT